MSIHRVTTTAVTLSGYTNGTWATVDLDSFVTVPSGSVAAVITVEVPGGTNRTIGLREASGKAEIANYSHLARSLTTFVVPMASGNTIDLNTSSQADTNFYVSGFLSSAWTLLDYTSSPTTIASNADTLTTTTVSAAPVSATLLVQNLNGWWRPTGQTTTLGGAGNRISGANTSFVTLNSSKEFDVACASTITVLGYCTTGVNWATWLSATELTDAGMTKSAASPNPVTWTDGPTTFTGKNYVYLAQQNFGTGKGFATRANGDSVPALATSLTNCAFGALTPLTSGVYEYAAENVTQSDIYALLTFDEPSGSSSIAPLAASYYYN